MRPLERLHHLGLVNASLLAVHAVHVTDAERELLASAGVAVAHCPRSNLKLASGIADVGALRRSGIIVGLGTDGAASNNVLDILGEMRTAALLAKAVSGDPAALPAATALRMATLDGAMALGLGDVTGTIEAGKWADLTCMDLERLHSHPVYDPVSQLVYTAGVEQVSDVWVAGRHQVERGRLVHVSQDDIFERSAEWQQRITGTRNSSPGLSA